MNITRKKFAILILGLLAPLPVNRAIGSFGLRTVAFTGDSAPGIESGVEFDAFGFLDTPPILNNTGQVALTGLLAGAVNFSNDTGIWSEGIGSGLTLVARDGNIAPGTNVGFSDLRNSRIVLNNKGQTVFGAELDTSNPAVNSSNFRGIWSEGQGNSLALVARDGNTAPGTNANFRLANLHENLLLNSRGQTAFYSLLAGTGINASNTTGIWSEGGTNSPALIAREGNTAPGTPVGSNFSTVGNLGEYPVLNNDGQTAFRASFRPPGAGNDLMSDDGVWIEGRESGLTLVAREGETAPGLGPGITFGKFGDGSVRLNSQGQTAFRASLNLTPPGIDNSNNQGIWSEGGGNGLGLIAREGDQAPDTPSGTTFNFNNFTNNLALNNNGQVAFLGSTLGTEISSGIWSEGGGNGLELVAQSGKPAPGTEVGVNFQDFFDGTMVLNSRGQIAFYANLVGPGIVDFDTDGGIFAEDLAGNLRLIAREGGQIDVSDDPLAPDLRTISLLVPYAGNTGNGDGRPSSFNDLGQLVFAARFTDGSEGVFVSNLVAVPEPSAITILVSLALTLISIRGNNDRGHARILWFVR